MHRCQNAVAARLQRVVQVLAHRRGRSHRRERLGAHVLGVRAGEAHAANALDGPDRVQQLGEHRPQASLGVACLARRQLQIASVAVDVLTEQGDLADTFAGEPLDLGDDIGERTADLGAAHGGNDAERARVVAADLDGDPGVVGGLAARRQRAGEHGLVVEHCLVEDLGDRAAVTSLGDQFGRSMHVVRAEHDVDVRRLGAHQIAILLRQATGHDDLATVALFLPRLQPTERAVQLVVGVLADAACVEHDDVGVGLVGDRDIAVVFHQAGDSLGIVLVHLTPEGVDDVAAGHRQEGYRWRRGSRMSLTGALALANPAPRTNQ